ncbi:hypothetical protein ABIB82_002976 [Bradyrhizobium sp. i1.8.4]|uniref:hypothetical protein n=1 Tax=unclassified Bradyrhizobium TaxID=2631580 RepID=UPI003D222FA3
MSDDPPPQLKPRLAISLDQALAIIDRVAPRSRVASITELRGGLTRELENSAGQGVAH